MVKQGWSRRDLVKSTATGVLGLGVSAAVVDRMDQYIVGTKSSDGSVAAASVSDVPEMRIDLTEFTSMKLVCGVFSKARRESLLSRDDVAFVQPDRTLSPIAATSQQSTTGGQTVPWGIDRIDADVAHENGATGAGADVGVIDGGINDTHPDLEGNLADPGTDENHNSWVDCSGSDCNYAWSDRGGHGTHVAGTIAAADSTRGVVGVAPEATLHALKVCGANGGCRTSAIVEALRYAADQDWDVVNLSLGTAQSSPALQAAGEYALEAGVLPVAAAGNRGRPDSVGYPAVYDEFLAVSATNIEDAVAGFSSTGAEVDLAAPGKSVCSAAVNGHEVLSGTSMAAPHVAGAAAQVIAAGSSHTEARKQLLETAEDIGLSETKQGNGLVDVAAALGSDSDDDGNGDGTSCPS